MPCNIAKFNGTQWLPVEEGVNDRITDMVVYNDDLIVSGYFTTAGTVFSKLYCKMEWIQLVCFKEAEQMER